VQDPVTYFFLHLRDALRRQNLVMAAPPRPLDDSVRRSRRLYTHASPPLREVLATLNKDSDNLAAEVLLRTLGNTRKSRGITAQDGLAVVRNTLRTAFPRYADEVVMRDGAGLERGTKVSAAFMLALLRRVEQHRVWRAEFVRSLSLAGADGTLRYRGYPGRLHGRMRAKSGSLTGVVNLSGYFYPLTDTVVFSFLVNDSRDRHWRELQRAQDAVVTGIYDHLLGQEAPPEPIAKPEQHFRIAPVPPPASPPKPPPPSPDR